MNGISRGLRAWLIQRLSAVYIAIYLLTGLTMLAVYGPLDYAQWREWMACSTVYIPTAVFFTALLLHAWIGLRDIMMDYLKPTGLRFVCLVLVAGSLLALGLWVLRILFVGAAL